MKAIRIHTQGGPEVLVLEDVEAPQPGPGQLLIQVGVAGVNYADVGMRAGMMHGDDRLPATPGFEAAGRVVEVGDGVDTSLRGRLVTTTCQGGYAEYAVARAAAALEVPDGIDLRDAVAVPIQGITAYGVLAEAGGLSDGDSVVVTAAAGGVGTLAVQIARLLGASTVVGLASSGRKRDLVRELGADEAVDYTADDWTDALRAAAGPVDLVLDSVGGDVAAALLGLLRHRSGRMVTFGNASGGQAGIRPFDLVSGNLRLAGFSAQAWQGDRPWYEAAAEQLFGWMAAGELRVVRADTWPLEEAAAAHAALEQRRTIGKIALRVAEL